MTKKKRVIQLKPKLKQPRRPIPIHASDTPQCQRLWVAVFIQAMYDLKSNDADIVKGIDEWRGKDFLTVCSLANLCPSVVDEFLQMTIENGMPKLNHSLIHENTNSRPRPRKGKHK